MNSQERYDFNEIVDRRNTDCVKYDLLGDLYGKPDILPFWVADMDFRVPAFIIDALQEKLSHSIFGYPVKPEGFYRAICHWLQVRHNWDIRKEWILFQPGVVPAINLAVMAYTSPGDKIIIQPPVYPPFFSAVTNNGRTLLLNQLCEKQGRYEPDMEDLEQKARNGAKMLILSHPHNPVGRAWTKRELFDIADICCRYGVIILSDEIHSDLMFSGRKHIPMASIHEAAAAITITCMAPSKTFNLAGLASSFLVISDPVLRKTYENILEQVHTGMGNIFGIKALEVAYLYGEAWLEQLLFYLEGNLEFAMEFIRQNLPDIVPIMPEATYLLWLDFRKTGMNQQEMNDFMVRKAGIALNDGYSFGPGGEGFMRLNFACPRKIIEEGLNRLTRAMYPDR